MLSSPYARKSMKALFALLFSGLFIQLEAQLPSVMFDTAPGSPEVIYYNFYKGIQMIEIDYNMYEQRRVKALDAIHPTNSIKPQFYSHNAIILRDAKGAIVAQYNTGLRNLSKLKYEDSDFLPPDKVKQTWPHSRSGISRGSNCPSYGADRYFVIQNGKCGVIDTLGNAVLDIVYDNIVPYNGNFSNTKCLWYGGLNRAEKVVCYTLLQKGKWGFKNDSVFIAPKYEELIPFKKNVLGIKHIKWGLINYKEKMLLDTIYDTLDHKKDFFVYSKEQRLYAAQGDKLLGIINNKYEVVTQPVYLSIEDYVDNNKGGMYWACTECGCGFLNEKGHALTPFRYGEKPANPYGNYYPTTAYNEANKLVVLNKHLKEIGAGYDRTYEATRELFVVQKGNKLGLINLYDELVLPCEYESIKESFGRDFIEVKKDGREGLLDKNGKVVIPMVYDGVIIDNQEKLLKVSLNKKQSLFNYQGKALTPIVYDVIESYTYGLAPAQKGDKWGVLDRQGKELTKFVYDRVFECENEMCIVESDYEYGFFHRFYSFVNKKGKQVSPFKYDKVENFKYDTDRKIFKARVWMKNKEMLIDKEGHELK